MKLILKILLSLTILYTLLIFYISSIPNLRPPEEWLELFNILIRSSHHSGYSLLLAPLYPLLKQQDKAFHMLLYFGFGIVLFLTFKNIYKTLIKAVVFAFLLGVLYGASDEFHQVFVAGRSASMMDLAADATGVLLAQIAVIIVYAIMASFSFIYTSFKSKYYFRK